MLGDPGHQPYSDHTVLRRIPLGYVPGEDKSTFTDRKEGFLLLQPGIDRNIYAHVQC